MDNIQFWIYVAFAALYFLSRALKKKPDQKRPKRRPRSPLETEDSQKAGRTEKPKTFEELLAEFTGESTQSKKEEDYTVEEPEPFADAFEKVASTGKKNIDTASNFEDEGTKRSFADEESKRIYDESVKRAEESALEFSRDEKFLKESERAVSKGSAFAAEIKASLQNQDQAKKAIILSEIINRRY